MNFWEGQVVLKHDDREQTLDARVFLDDEFDLKIETPDYLGLHVLFSGSSENIICKIPGVAHSIDVFLHYTSTSESGEQKLIFAPKRSPIWRNSLGSAVKGRAALINFAGFKSRPYFSSPILLNACGWLVTIVPVSGRFLSYPKLLQSEEHKITHQLEFERSDHAEFSGDDMRQFLADVSQFFSFCHGGWVSTGFAVGMNEHGIVVAEEWGIGRMVCRKSPVVSSTHLILMVLLSYIHCLWRNSPIPGGRMYSRMPFTG